MLNTWSRLPLQITGSADLDRYADRGGIVTQDTLVGIKLCSRDGIVKMDTQMGMGIWELDI